MEGSKIKCVDVDEVMETARAEGKPKAPPPKVERAVNGAQVSLFTKEEDKESPPSPPKPKGPSRAILDDMVHMAVKRPPTSDYVKGVMDGVRYAAGLLQPDQFSKAWHQYVRRLEGRPTKSKKAKSRKPKRTAKAKRKTSKR